MSQNNNVNNNQPTIANIPPNDTHYVINNPSGETKIGYISTHNPYIEMTEFRDPIESRRNTSIYASGVDINTDEGTTRIPVDLSIDAFDLEVRARNVRFVSFLDTFLSVFYLLVGGGLLNMIGFFSGAFGYYGAKTFRRRFVFVYFFFTLLTGLFRYTYPYIFILAYGNDDNGNIFKLYIYNIFIGTLDLIISIFVFSFWKKLPKNNLEREELLFRTTYL